MARPRKNGGTDEDDANAATGATGKPKKLMKRARRKSESPSPRSSAYRGVTRYVRTYVRTYGHSLTTHHCKRRLLLGRHRWTGRFEAHLWDKDARNGSRSKKGKQGSPSPLHQFLSAAPRRPWIPVVTFAIATDLTSPPCSLRTHGSSSAAAVLRSTGLAGGPARACSLSR